MRPTCLLIRRLSWTYAVLVFAAWQVACGGQAVGPDAGSSGSGAGSPDATAPGWAAHLGVYSDCSFSTFGIGNGIGGVLTLTQETSGALTVVFGSPDGGRGPSFSLDFTPTSGTSATLDPADQPVPWAGFCWTGPIVTDSGVPIDPSPTSLTLLATSGALTYDAETVYLSVTGTPEIDARCEGTSAGSITCARQ